jgi:hypothetical protein
MVARGGKGGSPAARWSGATNVAVLLALVSACGDPPLLDLKIVTPAGDDPLANVAGVRLLVTDPFEEQSFDVTGGGELDVELELEVRGEVGSVVFEGWSATGELIARGETPPLVLRPVDERLALLVARTGAVSRLKPTLPNAALGMTTVVVPASGVLLAGGEDSGGKPQRGAALYDFYFHLLESLPRLPAPRSGAVGAFCGASCAVLVGGVDDKGHATKVLRYDGLDWRELDDGLSPPDRRRGAGIAALADESYLVVGGVGAAGPLNTALVLDPGTAASTPPTLKLLPARMAAARATPAVAGAKGKVILVAGGQQKGEAPAELYFADTATFQALTLDGPAPLSGTAAVGLGDGRLAIIGGRDEAGLLLRDAWIIDPETLKVSRRADVLEQGRAGHQALLLGEQLQSGGAGGGSGQIVVVGGERENGLAGEIEVLAAKDLAPAGKVPLGARRGLGVAHMGGGSLLVAGGEKAGGGLEQALEVYQTKLRYKHQ